MTLNLSKVSPIMKRELRSYFDSAIAYIVLAVFLLVTGWFFASAFFLNNSADLRSFFSLGPLMLMFFAPAITMRLIAEEKKSGSIEWLVTMPVTEIEVILGKWLAALILTSIAILMTFPYLITILSLGNVDWGPVIGGYLGLILLAGSYLAIGILCSAITKSQIVSFIIALLISFLLFMFDKILFFVPEFMSNILQYLSTDYHFDNISRGVIDSRDLIFYFTLIIVALFLAARTLTARKWR